MNSQLPLIQPSFLNKVDKHESILYKFILIMFIFFFLIIKNIKCTYRRRHKLLFKSKCFYYYLNFSIPFVLHALIY